MAVVMFHFQSDFSRSFSLDAHTALIANGYLWVDFFFLLSGFILCYVHAEEFILGLEPYRKFLIKRIARIYPLHLFTLFLLLLPIFHPQTTTRVHGTTMTFVSNGLLLHAWGVLDELTWNYPSWSISAEWAAYLLFPAILIVFYRTPLALALPLAVATLFGLEWLATLADPKHTPNFMWLTYNFGWLRCVILFSMGVVIFRIFRARPAIMGSDFVFGMLAAGILIAMHFDVRDIVIIFLMCGLLCSAALNQARAKRLLSLQPIYYLGVVSYSIYMTQALVESGFVYNPSILNFITHLSASTGFLVYLLTCASVICAASIAYRLVEVPGRSLVNRLSEAAARKTEQSA